MSVKVDLASLADTVADYGYAYLLTVSEDRRPHAVAVEPHLHAGRLAVAGLGRRTLQNLTERPDVTLLFPPAETGGYSLIVDGHGAVTGEGAEVVPVHAVLHRPADHATGPTEGSCGNDCHHLPTG
ncbi:MAG TPA: pyridoxamine 5'-phosphate oxidase family protein [Nocardioidaceae bacterium]